MPTFDSRACLASLMTSSTPTSVVALPILQMAKISLQRSRYLSATLRRAVFESRRPAEWGFSVRVLAESLGSCPTYQEGQPEQVPCSECEPSGRLYSNFSNSRHRHATGVRLNTPDPLNQRPAPRLITTRSFRRQLSEIIRAFLNAGQDPTSNHVTQTTSPDLGPHPLQKGLLRFSD